MAALVTFVRERFPIVSYLLIATGLATTGGIASGAANAPVRVAIGALGIFLFFTLLRLMDEVKDLDTDRIAHPDRPLPRGLVMVSVAQRAIVAGVASMAAFALLATAATNVPAGASYGLATAYLWLMYHEFYNRDWLQARPLSYALSHQAVLIPLCGFAVYVSGTTPSLGGAISVVLVAVGCFLTYEVCRKLDPGAHPVLRNCLQVHGRAKTFAIGAAATALSAIGAWLLGLAPALWGVELLLLIALLVALVRPSTFLIAERAGGLSLIGHFWALPAAKVFGVT